MSLALSPAKSCQANQSNILKRIPCNNVLRQHQCKTLRLLRCKPVNKTLEDNTIYRNNGNFADKLRLFPFVFWKFLRPHTIRGTVLGTTAVVSKVLVANQGKLEWSLLPRALLGLLALLCGNGYIVGINQVYDVEIDVVNKPFLPIASGELRRGPATALCLLLGAAGIAIVATQFDAFIAKLYLLGLLLGTVYSVPPLRLKQQPVAAFLIIATVRGFLLNFGVHHAVRSALRLPFEWSAPITFITCFATLFAAVIAITKDLPDTEGDRRAGVQTFATAAGVGRVARFATGLLLLCYAGAVAAAAAFPRSFNAPVMAAAHLLLAATLLRQAKSLHDADYSMPAVKAYYKWIWNLFYAEYALLLFF